MSPVFTTAPSLWGAIRERLSLLSQAPPLVPVSRAQPLPLSYAQQRLWFIQQADPTAVAYNLAFAWRLSGPLNKPALAKTLRAIAERHESLRTTFVESDGQPVQVVSPIPDVELMMVHLEEAELMGRLTREAQRPFDLAHGPLLRAHLFCLQEQETVLLLVMHHIVCDGFSMSVLFHELRTFYQAFGRGEPAILPPLPFQYADFAVWQQTWLRDGPLEEQLT